MSLQMGSFRGFPSTCYYAGPQYIYIYILFAAFTFLHTSKHPFTIFTTGIWSVFFIAAISCRMPLMLDRFSLSFWVVIPSSSDTIELLSIVSVFCHSQLKLFLMPIALLAFDIQSSLRSSLVFCLLIREAFVGGASAATMTSLWLSSFHPPTSVSVYINHTVELIQDRTDSSSRHEEFLVTDPPPQNMLDF